MKSGFNILITAASRRVAMIRGFTNALRKLGLEGRVHASDTDRLSPGLRFCDRFHLVPLSKSPDYIARILEICKAEDIDMVVPTIDEEIATFGASKEKFRDAGVIPLVCDEDIGRICTDKYLTSKFFIENGFNFADTYLPEEIDPDKIRYPLFIKPKVGRGSVATFPIKNKREFLFFRDYVNNPVIQTFLTGTEYTIDVLAGLDGSILSVTPRERMVIRSGVCDRGRSRRDFNLINSARDICEKLGVIGPVNLQCMVENGKATFFEINPRFSGAIQLTVAAGADFFSMIIRNALGMEREVGIGDFEDNLLMMSYEESIFEKNGQ